jgi:hypothetical protein
MDHIVSPLTQPTDHALRNAHVSEEAHGSAIPPASGFLLKKPAGSISDASLDTQCNAPGQPPHSLAGKARSTQSVRSKTARPFDRAVRAVAYSSCIISALLSTLACSSDEKARHDGEPFRHSGRQDLNLRP